MRTRTSRGIARGFTILELMVTILVAAILVMIAAPSFRTALQRHRVQAAADDLQAAIQYARTEAVLRATYVSLCASADAASCAATTTYETGWLVYAHPVATTKASDVYDAATAKGMQILRVGSAVTLVSVRAVDGGAVTFGQQGQLEAVATRTNASQPMAMVLCAMANAKSAVGANTTTVPGTRVGISRFGGIAATKLATADTCLP